MPLFFVSFLVLIGIFWFLLPHQVSFTGRNQISEPVPMVADDDR
jgi:hypothetical protein